MTKNFSFFQQIAHKLQYKLLDLLAKKTLVMPMNQRKKLARLLTWAALDLVRLRRDYSVSAISRQLDLDHETALLTARKVYYNFLLNSFEMAGLKFFSNQQLLEKIECPHLHKLSDALKVGKGAIIISGHFGLWELVPPWLTLQGLPVTVVVRRQNNPEVDQWMEEMRQRHGAKTTDSGFGIREILKSLRQGRILALMVDQDNGKQGIFTRFFNDWASAPTGPAVISQKTGAPIIPLALFPNFGGHHFLRICDPIWPKNFSNDLDGQIRMTAAYTAEVEGFIRALPQHWFWLHRRWKTTPAQAAENPSVIKLKLL